MKNKTILIYVTFLFVLLGLVPTMAQDLHRWDERIVEEQNQRLHHIYRQLNELNIPTTTSDKSAFSLEEQKTLQSIIPDFQVNENAGPYGAGQVSPSIAVDGSGNFVITWQDYRNGDWDIYAQRYSSDGTASGSNFKVNDDEGSAGQFSPSISTDDSGNFVITWQDARNGVYDIYAQRYSSDGTLLGSNFKVNDDEGSAWQGLPSISTDGSGNFVITWMDGRNGDSNIYAQRYSSDGTTEGSNVKVNDDEGSAGQFAPSISMDVNGNFVITWMDGRNDYFDIYAQRYSSDGTTEGSNVKVNDDEGSAGQFDPSICTDSSGNFVITWQDDRNSNGDIYAQLFSSDGTAMGSNLKVNDDEGSTWQGDPSIAVDGSGNFVITWKDGRYGDWDIYAQLYFSDGTAKGNNVKVNNDEGSAYQWSPSISTDDSGNFVITWEDYRNGYSDIYGQRYSSNGTVLGSNFRVTNTGDGLQYSPDVKLWNNRIYNTWHDNRAGGTGYDIWANVLDWENPVAIIDDDALTSAFTLHQNYPNPFNPKTTIRYRLSMTGNVQLAIYNTLGQKVRMLVNEQQTPGDYIVQWDSRDDHNKEVPSGIYIYRMTTSSGTLAGKMVLVR